jgi:hypothetical protein
MLAHVGRLILLILLSPLFLIALGPLLVLAVWRGRQPMGPITLDASRYGFWARAAALLVGLVLWIVIWGGMAWFTVNAFSPPVVVTAPTPTLTPLPGLTPPATVTPAPPRPTPDPATPTEMPPTTAAPASAELTATPAATTDTPLPTAGLSPEPTATPTISPQATLGPADKAAVIAVVKEANLLLQTAMVEADESSLEKMTTLWRGLAMDVARSFVTRIGQSYAAPRRVEFDYINQPAVNPESTFGEVIVTSRERWQYGGPTKIDRNEALEFIYTLEQVEGQWVINRYTYRNLPEQTATPTATPAVTPTATPPETPPATTTGDGAP